ncbi:MAG: hypothetical protein FJ278_11750 [Planctomycetes bacterium]|nr:hypothetical protein [Planctomycetota bacterium]
MAEPPRPHVPEPSPRRRISLGVIIEDILIVLAIPVLWLTIFRLDGPICDVIQWVTLGAMVVVFVRRINRFRRPPTVGDAGSPTDN